MKPNIFKVLLRLDARRAFTRRFASGVAKYSRFQGSWIFYCVSEKDKEFLNQVKQPDINGTIVQIDEGGTSLAKKLSNIEVPIITIGKKVNESPNIIADSETIGELAAEHFFSRGFANFAYIGIKDMNMPWSQQRGNSFKKAIMKKGYKLHVYGQPKMSQRNSMKKEEDFIKNWIKLLPKPLALLACNDDRAQQVLAACKLVGIKVPDELSVLGIDNDEYICELADPPLSSVVMDIEKAGYEAAKTLDIMMKKKITRGHDININPLFIHTRLSTDFMAIDDSCLVNALRFIIEHSGELVSVDDVVNASGLSRRILEMRFRKTFGTSIQKKIRKVYIDHFSRMLLETNLTISQIAYSLGCENDAHIARRFKKEMGITPLEYRKKFSFKL